MLGLLVHAWIKVNPGDPDSGDTAGDEEVISRMKLMFSRYGGSIEIQWRNDQ